MPIPELRTARLLLRGWRGDDRSAFAALNRDPRVMEHFPSLMTEADSDAMVDRIEAGFAEHGFGLWVVERSDTAAFCGFVGLSVPGFAAPFMPAVEVGWRLAAEQRGQGVASEAARAALAFGFDEVGLDEVVSFTSPHNARSVAVMRRLGMTHDPADDFDHPRLPEGHWLQRHVLYRMSQTRWRELGG